MVFASLTFLCFFLPLNIVLYFALDNKAYRNFVLTFFSLAFYAWGEPIWVSLLLFSAFVDYGHGLYIEKNRGRSRAVLGLISSLVVNLGLLALFKYNVFLYENVNYFLQLDMTVPKYALPIGISFYTFQTISYTIDVYRGKVKAQRSPLNFLMYVSLYPQLVAGPIVRYEEIAKQIEERSNSHYDKAQGVLRFCIGLFKKVFIANIAGALASRYLDADFSSLSISEAWFGIVMFSLQIYFDFSGYSDMAIGLGRLFGFSYGENFRYPYIAKTAQEFWQRWHISLGSFFRDYIYIPLGGNKRWFYRNLFVVWALTGLWHGASWNFVLWGLYFGLLLALERLFLKALLSKIPRLFSHIYLLFVVILGWALFYFEDLGRLTQFFALIFGQTEQAFWDFKLGLVLAEHAYWLILTLLLCLPIYPLVETWWQSRGYQERYVELTWFLTTALQFGLLLLSIALLVGNTYNPFIYYRF